MKGDVHRCPSTAYRGQWYRDRIAALERQLAQMRAQIDALLADVLKEQS